MMERIIRATVVTTGLVGARRGQCNSRVWCHRCRRHRRLVQARRRD
jgi:hypothetical protein